MTKHTVQAVKAGLLARVSTDGQENNSSLDAQLRRDREHCQKKNYAIVVERKEIFSGGFVLARSVLNELFTMMANGQINCIVVDVTDRLGRGEVIAQCELLAKLNGGWIEYAQSGRDTSTVEGIALHATDQLVSGIERINIKRRTTGGKYAWAQKGRVITSSMRPYGYDFVIQYDDRGRRVDATLCIVEDEARVVLMIYEWVVYEGLTIRGVANRLTEMKIPKYTQKGLPHRKANRRSEWSRQTIAQLLRNTLYKGEWRFGKLKVERIDTPDGIRRKIARRSSDETVAVQVPAIVSTELWDAVQEQLAENHRKFRRPTKNLYPLRGRIRCALCGGMMVGHSPARTTVTTFATVTPAITRVARSAVRLGMCRLLASRRLFGTKCEKRCLIQSACWLGPENIVRRCSRQPSSWSKPCWRLRCRSHKRRGRSTGCSICI